MLGMHMDPNGEEHHRPPALARMIAGALTLLNRLGFFGSVLHHGAIATALAGALWAIRGEPVVGWTFVLAFALLAPGFLAGVDWLITRGEKPTQK